MEFGLFLSSSVDCKHIFTERKATPYLGGLESPHAVDCLTLTLHLFSDCRASSQHSRAPAEMKGKGELQGHFVKCTSQGQPAPEPRTSLSMPSNPSLPSSLPLPSARVSTVFPIGRDGFPPKRREDTTCSPFPHLKSRSSPFITHL